MPGEVMLRAARRQLVAAEAYRAVLLRELWRMRRNPYQRQGVADRRRELAGVRVRVGMLRACVALEDGSC